MLTHFCFKENKVFAYDDKCALVANLPTPITGAVPGRALMAILENSKANVELEQTESLLTITDGKKSSTSLTMLPEEAFLFLPDRDIFKSSTTTILLTREFAQALAVVAECGTDLSIRPNLSGVTFKPGEKASIHMYSTDNVTLTSANIKGKASSFPAFILGIKACSIIASLFKEQDSGRLRLANDGSAVVFEQVGVRLFAKTIPAKVAEYEEYMRTHLLGESHRVEIPKGFAQAVNKAVTLTSEDTHRYLSIKLVDATKLSVTTIGKYGELDATLKLKEEVPDHNAFTKEYLVDPQSVAKFLPTATELILGTNCLALMGTNVTHVLVQKVRG